METIVLIAGKFDFLHELHEGHKSHIREAAKRGKLIAITHPDWSVTRYSMKGFCHIPLKDRIKALQEEPGVFKVIVAWSDLDGTITNTLKIIRKDYPSEVVHALIPGYEIILAKGAGRNPDNMPANEVEMCRVLGIRIIYGVSDAKITSSSEILLREKANGQVTASASPV